MSIDVLHRGKKDGPKADRERSRLKKGNLVSSGAMRLTMTGFGPGGRSEPGHRFGPNVRCRMDGQRFKDNKISGHVKQHHERDSEKIE
ncbi:MAG TPA: hypothetical protein VGM54_02270 [Chthoniobacter sp.]|jgi:hypothetical protein